VTTISKLIAAAGVAAASFMAFAGVVDAAPMAAAASVSCVNGDGAMSLTISNPASDADAEFVVTNPSTFVASVIELGPNATQTVTVDGLSDGSVIVPVQFNGTDASVSGTVSCDSAECAEGVLSVVTDDAGVQHEACVASAADAPVAPAAAPHRASLAPQTTGPATPTTSAESLPKTGAGMGGIVIAMILVGTGSVASLLARRKS
jgi:LPXTG-motif cell wall-anchored protein